MGRRTWRPCEKGASFPVKLTTILPGVKMTLTKQERGGKRMVDNEEKIVLVDEDGEEHEFVLIDVLEVDGAEYAILEPMELDVEESEAIILKVGKDENGEDILYDIEDDEEWEKVADRWQEMIEEDVEE
jgi:uncharacterized protein YrzB (UPF0473 family)